MKRIFYWGIGGILLINQISGTEELHKTSLPVKIITEIATGSNNRSKNITKIYAEHIHVITSAEQLI